MTDNSFAGRGSNTYQGPQNEASYIEWVNKEYNSLPAKFPPGSIVCFEDNENVEYVVVSYTHVAGTKKPTVGIIDLTEIRSIPYEEYPARAKKLCPEHELPKLKYLYNQNGEDLTARFRGHDKYKACRNAIEFFERIENISPYRFFEPLSTFKVTVDKSIEILRNTIQDSVKAGNGQKLGNDFVEMEKKALVEVDTPEFKEYVKSRIKRG